MKSNGCLFLRIVDPANLRAALARAARGKLHRASVARFVADSESELECLREELVEGRYRPCPLQQFTVTDPKPRRISCADFRDRVVHHALCAVIGPVIERRFIGDSYACRRGFGGHRAVLRARHFTRVFPYALKTDIRRFYDSVDHGRLLALVRRLFREKEVRALLETIVGHPLPGQAPGRGLPIGNLTSQWLANLYLDPLDHFVKDGLGVKGYVRYMDDLVLWSRDKADLWRWSSEIEGFLADGLGLELNPARTVIAPVGEGVAFLGWRIFPHLLRRQAGRLRRSRRLFRRREERYLRGELSAGALVASVQALVGLRRSFGAGGDLRSAVEV